MSWKVYLSGIFGFLHELFGFLRDFFGFFHNLFWLLPDFFLKISRFAFKDHGHGFVNELEGLSQQPCMQADLHMSNQLSRQVLNFFWISHLANSKTGSPQATLLQQGVGARFWPRPGQHKHPARQVCKSHQSSQNPKNRDHGIPGYSKVREKCGLSPILSLQERPAEINEVNQWVKTLPAWLCGLLSSVGELGQAEWGLSKSGRRRSLCGWPLRDSSGRYCDEH